MANTPEGIQAAVVALSWTNWTRAAFVLVIMCVAGTLGSYCRSVWEKDEAERAKNQVIWPGIAAALVVPLFLSVGGNSIFAKELTDDVDVIPNLFIIAGFCVLAGAAAPSFVSALAQRALSVARQADKKAERAENLGEVATEPAENNGQAKTKAVSDVVQEHINAIADPHQKIILSALVNSEYAWRAVGGLAQATGLERSSVRAALMDLKSRELVVDKISTRTGNVLYQACG